MDETIEQIESVTADEVSAMARELFNPIRSRSPYSAIWMG
jgi:hypothetical protein